MNYAKLLSSMVLAVLLTSCAARRPDVLRYVDPNIGTAHSRWFFYTPAAVPHGMAKLAPSTNGHYGNKQGWEAVGYDTRHQSIEGFVHFHEWQVGGVSVMPATGALKVKPGDLDNPDSATAPVLTEKINWLNPVITKFCWTITGLRRN
nr:hypothetical protein [Siphonobacter sp. BAB-5405]